MQDLKKEISIRIRKFLEENNITRKEFAKILNKKIGYEIPIATINSWINGIKEPRLKAREVLYDILGISVNDTNSQYGKVLMYLCRLLTIINCKYIFTFKKILSLFMSHKVSHKKTPTLSGRGKRKENASASCITFM